MPTTSNFGWTTPADTDLVKDGAAAIRTLGNGVDASLVDLKGGTTGQVLSKATNTDLDYTWITPNVGDITEVQAGTGISVASGTGPIPVVTNTVATAIDAKGDLIVGTGADTFARLAVGTNGHTLVAKSSEATGLAWEAPVTGGMTLLSTTTLASSATNITGIASGYNDLVLIIKSFKPATDGGLFMRINNTGSGGNTYYSSTNTAETNVSHNASTINIAPDQDSAGDNSLIRVLIPDYTNTTTWKWAQFTAITNNQTTNTNINWRIGVGVWNATSAINELNFFPASGNFTSGSVLIYGVK